MKAIILAAGTGSRLGEVTKTTPKCLIEFGNKTIAEYQIEALRSNNIADISMVIGYCADMVRNKLNDKGVKFHLNKDFDKTGMLESLYCAKDELNDDIILLYGDIVFKTDLIKRLLDNKDDFCLVVDRKKEIVHESENSYEEYHGKKLSKGSTKVNIVDGQVKKISKTLTADEASAEFIGIIKFSKKSIDKVQNKTKELIESGDIKKYPSPSYLIKWLIGNNEKINVVYTDDITYEEIDYSEDLDKARAKFG